MNTLQKIGALIRKAREEQSLSIEEVAGSLRIGQEQLIALENGEEDLLPEKVFIKAMLRRVAERLHLDLGILINEFQMENATVSVSLEQEQSGLPFELNIFRNIPGWALITGLIGVATSTFAITILNSNPTQSIKNNYTPTKKIDPKTKAVNSSYHIVAPGQTLSTISRFHEIPIKKLIKINQINNPDKLKIGKILYLKDKQSRQKS